MYDFFVWVSNYFGFLTGSNHGKLSFSTSFLYVLGQKTYMYLGLYWCVIFLCPNYLQLPLSCIQGDMVSKQNFEKFILLLLRSAKSFS